MGMCNGVFMVAFTRWWQPEIGKRSEETKGKSINVHRGRENQVGEEWWIGWVSLGNVVST